MIKNIFKNITDILSIKTFTLFVMVFFPSTIFASSYSTRHFDPISFNMLAIAFLGLLVLTLSINQILLHRSFKKKMESYNSNASYIEKEASISIEQDADLNINELYALPIDILTKLPNRNQLFDYVQKILSVKGSISSKFAVFIVNLDFFRSVNNNLGHEIGDKILIECSSRLKALYQDGAYIARMDGDEFAIVLEIHNMSELFTEVDKLHKEMKKPVLIMNQEVYLSASIGISIFPEHGNNAKELIKNAAAALNVVKNTRRNSYKMYSPEIINYNHQKFNLHSELRQAIEHNEFVLHYQPKVDSKTAEIVGIEALIRWNHPTRGLLYPIDFIPIAEETGIIKYIDEWVLHTACTQLKEWQQEGISSLRLAVNLSAWQFKDQHLVETVIKVLEDTQIPASSLELEITETIAMENLSFTQSTLARLMNMGVTISIDDFGTGYSSLNYLKHFPVSFLKIDKSFVADMIEDKNTLSIVKAIIDVAHALQLKVIAEGVEDQNQFDVLMNMGCDEIQGYHISRPLNVEDIKKRFIGMK